MAKFNVRLDDRIDESEGTFHIRVTPESHEAFLLWVNDVNRRGYIEWDPEPAVPRDVWPLSDRSIQLLGKLAELGIYGRTAAAVAARFIDQALLEFVERPVLEAKR